eukprot:TRINITY_DN206_c1_g1_i1.p1 TRINITY_DN206_c1_g1~~TRINITY_DN206_c1_g1_i1.p1  ORF type:complete len:118 (+),score=17.92 TRINITY_DN206_c1_g1_i1:205-558(+)
MAESITNELLEQWDDLFDHGKNDEVLPLIEKAFTDHPDNVELAWRLARCQFEFGTSKPGDVEFTKEWYQKAYETGLKAIDINSNHYAGHKWCGIALGSLGDFLSTTEMIKNSFNVRV